VAEVRVQLAKHGLMIIPETVDRHIDRYTTMKPGYKQGDPPKEQASFHATVKSRYTLVNVEDPNDRMVCEWDAGEALDTSDKATNKATTASHKYFLMKLFNISDKDDPDADSHEAPVKEPSRESAKAEPATLTADQVTELLGLAKLKGHTTKEGAVEFLNGLSLSDDFTTLWADQFDRFKKTVTEHGWKKPSTDAEVPVS
jgi:hypothetical protein